MPWALFPADVPRFVGTQRRLLIEGQRTNVVPNPRCEGAVLGVVVDNGVAGPGALPTGWTLTDAANLPLGANGLRVEVVGTTWPGGGDGFVLRFSGTTTAAVDASVNFQNRLSLLTITGSVDAGWAAGVDAMLVAGSTAGFSVFSVCVTRGSGPGGHQGRVRGPALANTIGLRQRPAYSRAIGGNSGSRLLASFDFEIPTATAVDATVAFAYPMVEGFDATLGVVNGTTTPVLPPVGAPAASTRGADRARATLSTIGVGSNGACTVLWSGMIPQNAPSLTPQVLFQLDDGTNDNRFWVRNAPAGATIVAGRTTATTGADAASSGSMVAGSPFRVGAVIDGTGRIACSVNGAAVQAVTGGPLVGMTTLRLGLNAADLQAMNGETRFFRVLSYPVSDTELQTLTGGLPL